MCVYIDKCQSTHIYIYIYVYICIHIAKVRPSDLFCPPYRQWLHCPPTLDVRQVARPDRVRENAQEHQNQETREVSHTLSFDNRLSCLTFPEKDGFTGPRLFHWCSTTCSRPEIPFTPTPFYSDFPDCCQFLDTTWTSSNPNWNEPTSSWLHMDSPHLITGSSNPKILRSLRNRIQNWLYFLIWLFFRISLLLDPFETLSPIRSLLQNQTLIKQRVLPSTKALPQGR